MKQLKQHFKNHVQKLKLLVILFGIVAVVLVVVATVGTVLINQHRTQLGNYAASLRQTVEQDTQPLQGKDIPPEQVLQALSKLEKDLQSKAAIPQPTKVAGLFIDSGSTKTARSSLQTTREALVRELKTSQELITYQIHLAKLLDGLTVQNTKNLTELQALAKTWKETTDKLKQFSAPPILAEYHKQVVDHAIAVTAVTDALPALYQKQDETAFQSKKKALSDAITTLRAQGLAFSALAKTQDEALAKPLADLYQQIAKLQK